MSTQIEEEQLEQLKNFWSQYGKPVFLGVLIAVTVVAVWWFWQSRQETKRLKESAAYQQLLTEIQRNTGEINVAEINNLAKQLESYDAHSGYTQFAKLFVARLAVKQGALDDAVKALQAILDKPDDNAIAELARQRLAQVLVAQDKPEEALKLLAAPVDKAFVISRNEIKGDLLVKIGRVDEARKAYNEALAVAKEKDSPSKLLLQLKLNDLAKEDA